MKNPLLNKIFMSILAITFFGSWNINAQEQQKEEIISVSIDWNAELNSQHIYIQEMKIMSEKHEDFIINNYRTNKDLSLTNFSKKERKKIKGRKRAKDALVYSINNGKTTYLDTVRNSVHYHFDNKDFNNTSEFELPVIEGDLPSGVTTYLEDTWSKYKTGIELPTDSMNVKIEVLSLDEKPIFTLENKVLNKGWHHYSWKTKELKDQIYLLRFEVNSQVRTHQIELDKSGFSLNSIKHFFKRIF